jgi:hypothetical protein
MIFLAFWSSSAVQWKGDEPGVIGREKNVTSTARVVYLYMVNVRVTLLVKIPLTEKPVRPGSGRHNGISVLL